MTVLKTLKLRTAGNAKTDFIYALNKIVENPEMDAYKALFEN